VSDDQDKPHVTQSSNSDAPPTAYFRVYSKPPGPGEPGYSEDVRRDVKDAIEQLKAKLPGEEFANLAKMAQQPSPLMKSAEGVLSGIGRSMSTPMHPRDRRFYLAVAFASRVWICAHVFDCRSKQAARLDLGYLRHCRRAAAGGPRHARCLREACPVRRKHRTDNDRHCRRDVADYRMANLGKLFTRPNTSPARRGGFRSKECGSVEA